jgi:hypothetical protein
MVFSYVSCHQVQLNKDLIMIKSFLMSTLLKNRVVPEYGK